jgi:DNA-binding GntR family transcriptional regulator
VKRQLLVATTQVEPAGAGSQPEAEGFINNATILQRIPVSLGTIRNWRNSGKLPFVKLLGRRVLYHWPTVQQALLRMHHLERRGLKVSTELLGVGHHVPSLAVREKLQLKEGDKTLCISRLRGTSEVFPMVFLQSEIPASFGIDPHEDFCGSLYRLIEQKYRIPIEWAEERIFAGRATPEEAKHLKMRTGDVVLIMERRTFTRSNQSLEYVRAVYWPEHYTFSLRLKR